MKTILKRPEIWILFSLIVLAAWWANQAEVSRFTPAEVLPVSAENRTVVPGTHPNDLNLLELNEVSLQPGDGGTLVELTLLGRSGTEESVLLDESNLALTTGEGVPVPRFFLPFDLDPMLPADQKSLVTLKFWLKNSADVLWLTFRDQTLKIEMPAPSV